MNKMYLERYHEQNSARKSYERSRNLDRSFRIFI